MTRMAPVVREVGHHDTYGTKLGEVRPIGQHTDRELCLLMAYADHVVTAAQELVRRYGAAAIEWGGWMGDEMRRAQTLVRRRAAAIAAARVERGAAQTYRADTRSAVCFHAVVMDDERQLTEWHVAYHGYMSQRTDWHAALMAARPEDRA